MSESFGIGLDHVVHRFKMLANKWRDQSMKKLQCVNFTAFSQLNNPTLRCKGIFYI